MHDLDARGGDDDAAFEHFRRLRSELSRKAWQTLTDEVDCDRGPLSKTGVAVFPLDEDLARRLRHALMDSPMVRMTCRDFALGYVGTGQSQCDYLNECNRYRKLTPTTRALLVEFLATAGPMVESLIGHPYRIASTRQFQLVPHRILADKHVDGWPVAMRKIFILPEGCGRHSSTTWFRQRDGIETTLESEKPIWVVFENSVVLHQPISGVALRPTLELDFVPARENSFDPVDAGLGGWYPTFPSEAEWLTGTRDALEGYFAAVPGGAPPRSWPMRARDSARRLWSSMRRRA
ncbi:hypothetical protein BH11PSE3_BH11PSE3_16730 [soil metagenome]